MKTTEEVLIVFENAALKAGLDRNTIPFARTA